MKTEKKPVSPAKKAKTIYVMLGCLSALMVFGGSIVFGNSLLGQASFIGLITALAGIGLLLFLETIHQAILTRLVKKYVDNLVEQTKRDEFPIQ